MATLMALLKTRPSRNVTDIAIFRQTAEDRHILRSNIAVEQQLVARGKELCNASNHPLLVIAEFPVIGERIPGSQPIKPKPPLDGA